MTATASPGSGIQAFRSMALAGLVLIVPLSSPRAQHALPDSIAAPGHQPIMTVHAVGAQIYECAADASGTARWRFREPIAALLVNGRTVGRHFTGPSWQLTDGSLVVGRVAGNAPAASANDIPWLKLTTVEGQTSGQFATVTVIQRINTSGGTLSGACDSIGAFRPVPYSSDYVFLAKAG